MRHDELWSEALRTFDKLISQETSIQKINCILHTWNIVKQMINMTYAFAKKEEVDEDLEVRCLIYIL